MWRWAVSASKHFCQMLVLLYQIGGRLLTKAQEAGLTRGHAAA